MSGGTPGRDESGWPKRSINTGKLVAPPSARAAGRVRRVWMHCVVMHTPPLDEHARLGRALDTPALCSSSRSLPLKLAMYPFFHKLPGPMNAVATSTPLFQLRRGGGEFHISYSFRLPPSPIAGGPRCRSVTGN